MHRLAWLVITLPLAACGGSKTAPTMTVTCSGPGGVQLVGAASIDVLGDLVNGRPTMNFPDPANPGRTGTISVEPHNNCRITTPGPS